MKSCGLIGRLLAGWRYEVCFAGHKMSPDTYQPIIKYSNENKFGFSSIGIGRSVKDETFSDL